MVEFMVIVRNVFSERPEVFIMRPEEVLKRLNRGEKEGRISYWLHQKEYEGFRDNWERIGAEIE